MTITKDGNDTYFIGCHQLELDIFDIALTAARDKLVERGNKDECYVIEIIDIIQQKIKVHSSLKL